MHIFDLYLEGLVVADGLFPNFLSAAEFEPPLQPVLPFSVSAIPFSGEVCGELLPIGEAEVGSRDESGSTDSGEAGVG